MGRRREKSIEADVYNADGSFSTDKAELIYAEIRRAKWPEQQKIAMLTWLRSAARREEIKTRYANAVDLAASVDPDFNVTPALTLISDEIEAGPLSGAQRNLIITMPPQEGKSTIAAVWTPLRALQLDPNRRIILAAYGDTLAEEHSSKIRTIIDSHGTDVMDSITGVRVEDKIGLKLSSRSNRVSSWGIEGGIGGLKAVGIGSAITGRAADLFIIDDPFKNMMEADSPAHRRKINEWMNTVARTRLSPQASMILIQCMTGDTPVLRPDGTETPLRDIRPGDRIATYESGIVGTSFVRNWCSQGVDMIFTITLKSGRSVRANARHPFLISEGGREVWRRVDELQPGNKCLAVRGPGRHARLMDALIRCRVKVSASPATARRTGPADAIAPRPNSTESATCAIVTASRRLNTTIASWLRAVFVPVAGRSRPNSTCRSIGTASSASTTTMTLARSEGCSATTATSWSGMPERLRVYDRARGISTEEIISIEPSGVEEVFDIQVEATENFIANGLVSHNTRWHPDDLAGTVIAGERKLAAEHRTWKLINIPAVAESNIGEVIITDSLNREPGEAMISSRGRTKDQFEATRRSVGERTWYAMYQGSPRNPAGGLFERAWFEPRLELVPPMPVAAVVGVDPADSGEGDETGIIGGYLGQDGTVVLAEDWSAQMSSDAWGVQAVTLALTMGAREIAMEAFAAANAYVNVIKSAWRGIHADAVAKAAAGASLTAVEQRACAAEMPFAIYKWRTPGDPVGRAAQLRQALETKKCRTVEYKLGVFEAQAADWQAGQHCPDRVSAAVITHHRLAALGAGQMSLAAPITGRPNDVPAWMKRKITAGPTGGRNNPFTRRVSAR